jgi:hypothetical protein
MGVRTARFPSPLRSPKPVRTRQPMAKCMIRYLEHISEQMGNPDFDAQNWGGPILLPLTGAAQAILSSLSTLNLRSISVIICRMFTSTIIFRRHLLFPLISHPVPHSIC